MDINKLEYCDFFKMVCDNPEKTYHGITVRYILGAKQHLSDCDKCYILCSKTADKYDDSGTDITLFGANSHETIKEIKAEFRGSNSRLAEHGRTEGREGLPEAGE